MRSLSITALCALLYLLLPNGGVFAQGQQGSGSPYSAYGFGDLFGNPQVSQALMGVAGIGTADLFSVSSANPASYVGLARPVFEAGGFGKLLSYKLDGSKAKGQRTDLLGLTLGVPFGKGKWGFALGLQPVSNVEYQINNFDTLDSGSIVRHQYSGAGGLNKAFIGLARTIWQTNDTIDLGTKLTFGANLNYLFGSLEESRRAYYTPSGGYYNTVNSSLLVVRSPTVNAGLQFSGDLRSKTNEGLRMEARREIRRERDKRLEAQWINDGNDPSKYKHLSINNRPAEALRYRIGIASELPTDLAARHTGFGGSFISGTSGDFNVDTTYNVIGARGTIKIPPSYSVGISMYNSRWTATLEYRLRDWSALGIDIEGYQSNGQLGTRAVYSLGGSFIATYNQNASLWLRNTYRMGLRYTSDYLVVENAQLREMAVTGGLSIPLGSISRSRINVGVEYALRGDAAGTLLQERAVGIYLGISIIPEVWDQWFRKRRID